MVCGDVILYLIVNLYISLVYVKIVFDFVFKSLWEEKYVGRVNNLLIKIKNINLKCLYLVVCYVK